MTGSKPGGGWNAGREEDKALAWDWVPLGELMVVGDWVTVVSPMPDDGSTAVAKVGVCCNGGGGVAVKVGRLSASTRGLS